ncbi:MAG: hypothetical protein COA79_15680 [Planctomycetota bacterium]|nr:MAG: hypothetical protein COA79_15680 [Planctomycetota bacterium]
MFLNFLCKIVARLARILSRYRGKPFTEAIEKLCSVFHRSLNNLDFNMERNGEGRVLRIITNSQPQLIFDVGANVGEWSKLVSKMVPSCKIHAFEIVPSTYEQLLHATDSLSNVMQINYGLSSKEDMITISLGKNSATATGCRIEGMSYHDNYYDQEIQCKTVKACTHMMDHKINNIDFVKIDVEGMDLQVIKGFEDQLQNVCAVQFEYGIFNISSHDLLADFYNYLINSGFVVGKIYPRYVAFQEYHYNLENFHGSNFLAVKSNEKELISKLQSYSS